VLVRARHHKSDPDSGGTVELPTAAGHIVRLIKMKNGVQGEAARDPFDAPLFKPFNTINHDASLGESSWH
jgi:hypothetical protein